MDGSADACHKATFVLKWWFGHHGSGKSADFLPCLSGLRRFH